MKKFIIISILMALFASGNSLMAQDNQGESLGLPGDNLNLYAVMKLFQESKTLEDFERSLNDQNSTINNLDLNGDNLVDYIKVIDNVDGDVHNIVLQVAVSPKENQDVAVFTVQRFQNGQVQIQLTGIHGVRTHGITTMGISIIGIMTISDITTAQTFIAIRDGTTFIIRTDVHIRLM